MGELLQDAVLAMLAVTILLSIGGLILHLEAPDWARRVDLAAIIAAVLTAASIFIYAWTRPFWQQAPAGPELAGEGANRQPHGDRFRRFRHRHGAS